MPAADAPTQAASVLACPDCGLEQRVPPIEPGMVAACSRCGGTLERRAGSSIDAALAIVLAASLLIFPANLLTLMEIRLEGMDRQDWIASGSGALWDQGYRSLSVLVASFTVIAPPLWLLGLVVVLSCTRLGIRRSWLGPLFRWILLLRPWAMADVFLVGSMVAFTRLQAYAAVEIGPGGWLFIAVAFAALAVDPSLDRRRVWSLIADEPVGPAAPGDFACLSCDRRCSRDEEGHRCPRCGAMLCRRKIASVERTAALVVASYLLYVPAMMFPVMTVIRFGRGEANTIISGVGELISLGMWPLAIIVFLASIFIPLFKLTGLTWFLIAMRRGSSYRLVMRTKLYRFIDRIGRWSNIDVFMISILAALVQFGSMSSLLAEPGAVSFGAVVILTMLASHSFDPRLMWDAVRA